MKIGCNSKDEVQGFCIYVALWEHGGGWGLGEEVVPEKFLKSKKAGEAMSIFIVKKFQFYFFCTFKDRGFGYNC